MCFAGAGLAKKKSNLILLNELERCQAAKVLFVDRGVERKVKTFKGGDFGKRRRFDARADLRVPPLIKLELQKFREPTERDGFLVPREYVLECLT